MAADAELLQAYAQNRSESAFTELVQRHIDLVYSAALREAHGDASLAEDITQGVFVELAKKASSLVRHPALAGWLYTCVRRMAANLHRSEERRQRREEEAQTMNELLSSEPSEPVWRQVQPVLDDAMHELNERDRTAVVLRFFEERSLKEVGLALGINENAARMRVDRALEKLQTLLAKRGITSTASGLAAAIVAGAVVAAPAGLSASVVTGALAVTASTTATTLAAVKLMTMTKLKLGIISAIAVATVATPVAIQHQDKTKLRAENQSLREQVDQLTQLKAENGRLSTLLAQANSSQLSKDQLSELMKLRGEVGLLRRQTIELGKLREENRKLRSGLEVVQGPTGTLRVGTNLFLLRQGQVGDSPADQAPQTEQNACVSNLRQIDSAVQQCALENKLTTNGVVTADQILPYLRSQQLPRCPSGGTYAFGPVTNPPTCSIPGHALQ